MEYRVKRHGAKVVIFDNVSDLENFVSDEIGGDSFNELLDSVYGTFEVCDYSFEASRILEEIDPIAYRCEFADYVDGILANVDFEQMEDGDTEYIDSMIVECVDDEYEKVVE